VVVLHQVVVARRDARRSNAVPHSRSRPWRGLDAVGLSGLLERYAAEGAEALTPAADGRSVGLFVYQEIPLGGARDRAAHDTLDGTRDGTLAEPRRPRLQLGARYDLYRVRSHTAEAKFGPGRRAAFDGDVRHGFAQSRVSRPECALAGRAPAGASTTSATRGTTTRRAGSRASRRTPGAT
jgi:hypothetical protein